MMDLFFRVVLAILFALIIASLVLHSVIRCTVTP